jgi:hypothetical protein
MSCGLPFFLLSAKNMFTLSTLFKKLLFLFLRYQIYFQHAIIFPPRYVHHDKNAASQQQQQPVQMLPSQQQQQPEMANGVESLQQQHLQLPEHQPQQVMSNQALKVKCPFCEIMFAARYAFFQHLCDKHFKETLAQQGSIL